MDMTELAERVVKVITATQHLPEGKVTPESTFEELGIDSLDAINIVFALENEFDISIPDEQLKTVRSVPDVTNGIAQLLAAKEAAAGA